MMAVFASQLGSLDAKTQEDSIRIIANHIRKMQDELEYRLSNLDSTNISEIDADETSILSDGKNINNIINGTNGEVSSLKQMGGIETRVMGAEGNISTLTQTSIGLQSDVKSVDGKVSTLVQTVEGMSLSVSNGSTSSSITLMRDGVAVSSQNISFSGMVTFTDLSRSGGTTINGSNITTGSINASLITSGSINANLITTGTLSSNYIRLYDSMAVYSGSSIAGYIGYTTSANDGSSGVHLKKGLGEVVATANGSKLTYNGSYNQISVYSGGASVFVGGVATYYFGQDAFFSGSDPELGNSLNPWGQIWSSNSAISQSDANMKHDIEALPEKYLELFDNLTAYRYKLNNGTSDRYHVGFTAQNVKAGMDTASVDPLEFGGWVKAQDEDGGDIYFLRYEEFIGILVAKVQEMDKRLEALEVSA